MFRQTPPTNNKTETRTGVVVFAATTMLAPSRASRSAIALPMPRDPPVMKTVFDTHDINAKVKRRTFDSMSLALSGSPIEALLLSEASRRNDVAHYESLIARCRAWFAPRSATSSLSHALLVALDLLVSQRFYRVDVVPVSHDAVHGCFVGWQKADSAVEAILPIAATAETQTPALFRSIVHATGIVTGVAHQGTTLAIVSSDSTVVYYRVGLHLRSPLEEAALNASAPQELLEAEDDDRDAAGASQVVGADADEAL
jgi:hypothetical protein